MGPTWGASGANRILVGLMLAPWTLLSGSSFCLSVENIEQVSNDIHLRLCMCRLNGYLMSSWHQIAIQYNGPVERYTVETHTKCSCVREISVFGRCNNASFALKLATGFHLFFHLVHDEISQDWCSPVALVLQYLTLVVVVWTRQLLILILLWR